MKSVTITEYEKLHPTDECDIEQKPEGNCNVPRHLLERLRTFDMRQALKNNGETVFDWSRRDFAKAKSYVGVIQIPGLTVEILPKISDSIDPAVSSKSLLFMLSYIKRIPLECRNSATLRLEKMTFFEALISIFAEKLHTEFWRGIDHAYYYREENLNRFKGKLLVNEHIRHNAAHQERVYVGFDEFVSDTWLNRIIKNCCRILISMTTSQENKKSLRMALMVLDEVSDRAITMHDLDKITLSRNTERFSEIMKFCRMIISQKAPGFDHSRDSTFSLLFPMEVIFEEFVAAVLKRHFLFRDYYVDIQVDEDFARSSKDCFGIRPDIVLKSRVDKKTLLILDTKWKLLNDDENKHYGVSRDDMFQMYVYSGILNCPRTLLLYPDVGIKYQIRHEYQFCDGKECRVRIATIRMNVTKDNLDDFANNLKNIIDLFYK